MASAAEARAEDTDIFFLEGGGDGDLEPHRLFLSSLQKSQIFQTLKCSVQSHTLPSAFPTAVSSAAISATISPASVPRSDEK